MSSESRNHDHPVARAIVLLLLLSMLSLLLAPLAHAAGTFTDDDGNVHEGMIEAIAAADVTKGCNPAGTLYCPAENVTRGQMASFLARAFDLPASPLDFFPDDNGTTHEDNINRIAFAGVTLGFPDGTYKPNLNVRRDQMASFIARATGGLTPPSKDFFTDDDGNVHEMNINTLAENDISLGCNPQGTLYCPADNVRRDQMASFLGRALRLDPIEPTTTTTISTTSTTTTTMAAHDHEIRLSSSANRSSPILLESQTVGGDIYVFVNDEVNISQVDFYINNPAMAGPPDVSEISAPFDLAGTAANGTANPFPSIVLPIGANNLTALVSLMGGGNQVLSADFTVNNAPSLYFSPRATTITVAENVADSNVVMLGANDGTAPTFTVSEDAPWLAVMPTGGTAPANITVSVDAAGVSPGIRNATVTATAAGKAVAQLDVTFVVQNVAACSPLTCSVIQVSSPYSLDFESDHGFIDDADGEGTGFTWVMRSSNAAAYVPENIDLDTSAGTLSITTTSGILHADVNSQDDALGVGLDATSDVLLISTSLLNPPTGTGGFEQAGLWLGNHEDDYVKLVVSSFPGPSTVIELLEENSGVVVETDQDTVSDVSSSTVDLVLRADPNTSTVTGTYSIDGGPVNILGPISVPAGFFASAPPPISTNSFAGILTTHRVGPGPLTFVFDDFSVVAE